MAERDLIRAFERILRVRSERVVYATGDDAAVVRADGAAATSVDAMVEGVHFELATHSPGDVGHKALATALSDLAAMGAAAGEAYVALSLPPDFGKARAVELVQAMQALAARLGVTIAGGDVSSGRALSVTVAVSGWAESEQRLAYRSGARPGDLVGVTGELGGSGAGLLLLHGANAELDLDVREALVQRHLRPEPRLAEGQALAAAGVSSMID